MGSNTLNEDILLGKGITNLLPSLKARLPAFTSKNLTLNPSLTGKAS